MVKELIQKSFAHVGGKVVEVFGKKGTAYEVDTIGTIMSKKR